MKRAIRRVSLLGLGALAFVSSNAYADATASTNTKSEPAPTPTTARPSASTATPPAKATPATPTTPATPLAATTAPPAATPAAPPPPAAASEGSLCHESTTRIYYCFYPYMSDYRFVDIGFQFDDDPILAIPMRPLVLPVTLTEMPEREGLVQPRTSFVGEMFESAELL